MENLNKKEYQKFANRKVPKPTYIRNIIFAFIIGGGICTIGQYIANFLAKTGYNEEMVSTGTSIILVFLVLC